MDKALIAYLWDDAPPDIQALVQPDTPPQMVWVVPERWFSPKRRGLLPPALTALLGGYAGNYWGRVERFHDGTGTVVIAVWRAPYNLPRT